MQVYTHTPNRWRALSNKTYHEGKRVNPVGVSSGSLLNPQRPSTERFCCHAFLVNWINSRLATWKINQLLNIAGNGKSINRSYLDSWFLMLSLAILCRYHTIRKSYVRYCRWKIPWNNQYQDRQKTMIHWRFSYEFCPTKSNSRLWAFDFVMQ